MVRPGLVEAYSFVLCSNLLPTSNWVYPQNVTGDAENGGTNSDTLHPQNNFTLSIKIIYSSWQLTLYFLVLPFNHLDKYNEPCENAS